MPSLNGTLSIARNALLTHQTALQVTSQNVSNAQTEGYSRQRARIATGPTVRFTYGMLGTGIELENIDRLRDPLLDKGFREKQSRAASHGLRGSLLQQVEDVFGEPSETGLSATLDAFWNSWGDLANQPTSSTAKVMVRQRGQQVADAFNLANSRLDEVEDSIRVRLGNSVSELNRSAQQIAALNRQIVSVEAGNITAGDLRDTRDQLIDQVSKLGPVRVIEDAAGSVSVYLGEENLVSGDVARTLTGPELSNGRYIVRGGSGDPLRLGVDGGEVGGMLTLLNQELGTVRTDLDSLARELVLNVNDKHRRGWSAAGDALGGSNWDPATPPHTGSFVNFFAEPADPADITARSISLSQPVLDDADVIAAGYTKDATGDNQLALDLAALRDDMTTMDGGTTSYGGFYRNIVSGVALSAQAADNSSSIFETLTQQADARRQSVSGVSVDEELILLMQHQQAYTAASRVINTVDEMMQTLMQM